MKKWATYGSASVLILSLATVVFAGDREIQHQVDSPSLPQSQSAASPGIDFPNQDSAQGFVKFAPTTPIPVPHMYLPQLPSTTAAVLQPIKLTMRANEKAYIVKQAAIRHAREVARKKAAARAAQKAAKEKALKLKEAKAKAQLVAYRRAASRPVSRSFSLSSVAGNTSARAAEVALRYVGVPYRWGGASPAGFDCSGLVQYAFAQVGVSLPHSSYSLYNIGSAVSSSGLSTGDLLFFDTDGPGASHVGIYVGGGRFVDASGSHVQVNSLSGYWSSHYIGARNP